MDDSVFRNEVKAFLVESLTPEMKHAGELKAKMGKAGRYVSHNAMQLHGGIGTTDEFSVGHYFKRLAAIGVMFGSRDFHLSRYSKLSV